MATESAEGLIGKKASTTEAQKHRADKKAILKTIDLCLEKCLLVRSVFLCLCG
jgi:hypothetical protein